MSDPRLSALELQAAAKRMRVETTLDELKLALEPERMAARLLRSQRRSRAGKGTRGEHPDTSGLVKACIIACAALLLIEFYRRRKFAVGPRERDERRRIVHFNEA